MTQPREKDSTFPVKLRHHELPGSFTFGILGRNISHTHMQNNQEELEAIQDELAMAVFDENEARIAKLQGEIRRIEDLMNGPIA